MATNMKSTGNTTTQKSTAKEGSNDFPKAYARLRTVLDSLELTALRYCLKDTSSAKRIERAKEIEAVLIPIIREFENNIPKLKPSECPDGFFNCGGCCLPYPCVP
jgi:hypothetical protein